MIRSVFRQFYVCVKIVIFFLIPLELVAGDAFPRNSNAVNF